jgi:type VI secretion system protein ImpJ
LWGEGLFLRPQHFQYQDAYHEYRLTQMIQSTAPYFWGVMSLKVDKDALANNIVKLNEATALFRDGEWYSAPGQDALPPPLNLDAIETGGPIEIALAIPLLKDIGKNYKRLTAQEPTSEARYLSENQSTVDLFTESVTADITFLKKNVKLIAVGEPDNHLSVIPIMRVRRLSNGGYEVDPTYIAPSIAIRASQPLCEMLEQLLDVLEAKIEALYGYHREPSKHIIEFRSGDVASFWLLHTASTAHTALKHLKDHPKLHPERLFQELLRLAGALLTFSKKYNLIDLPIYRHEAPEESFIKLDLILRDLLETVISTKFFLIALNETRPSFHTGKLESERIDDRTTLFLAVSSSLPAAQLELLVPRRFKVGSSEDVDKLVTVAMPGVQLAFTPQVPSVIPVRPGTSYFVLQTGGELYERMLKAQQITIYTPTGIPELKLELIAVIQ